MKVADLKAWRAAWPAIEASNKSLSALKSFPSLAANDYASALEAMGNKEAAAFIGDLNSELTWAYSMLVKAQTNGNPAELIEDMINGATTPEYGLVRKYLKDYAEANGIDSV